MLTEKKKKNTHTFFLSFGLSLTPLCLLSLCLCLPPRRPRPQNFKADVSATGSDFSGSANANVNIDKDITAEVSANESGCVKSSVTHGGVVDGLKTTVSGEPLNIKKTLKIANTLLHGDFGFKADVSGVLATPKVDSSVCYNMGDAQIGAEASVCTVKGLTAYSVGAQTNIEGVTAAVVLADKFDTVKLSAVGKLDASVTAAAEAIYKVKSGDLKLNVGSTCKLENGHVAKVVLSSAGTVSSTYSAEVIKGCNGTACLQVDQQVRVF